MPGLQCPRSWEKCALLPVLGPVVVAFAGWLAERGFAKTSVRSHLRAIPVIDRDLRAVGVLHSSGITWQAFEECVRRNARDPKVLAALRLLRRCLEELGTVAEPQRVCDYKDAIVADYATYLVDVRGLVSATVSGHLCTYGDPLSGRIRREGAGVSPLDFEPS
jgi:hypothetical protein